MNRSMILAALLLAAPAALPAQAAPLAGAEMQQEKHLLELSRQKWLWMAEKNVEALSRLFDDQAVFVHMSRTMDKAQELEVIRTGNIEYRRADIKDISVRIIGNTAIVLSRIDLHAIVRGNVADNPFSVTETFVRAGGEWKLAALAFSRRSVPN